MALNNYKNNNIIAMAMLQLLQYYSYGLLLHETRFKLGEGRSQCPGTIPPVVHVATRASPGPCSQGLIGAKGGCLHPGGAGARNYTNGDQTNAKKMQKKQENAKKIMENRITQKKENAFAF